MSTAAAAEISGGVIKIDPDGVYTVAAIQKAFGLGRVAIESARRKGLHVRRIGRWNYVNGRDVIDYVRGRESASIAGS